MTIENREIDWEFEGGKAAIDVRYAGIGADIAAATHRSPRRAREELTEMGEDVALVIVNMYEAGFRDFIDFQSSVDKHCATDWLQLGYEISESGSVRVTYKYVCGFDESGEGLGDPSI